MSNTLVVRTSHRATPYSYLVVRGCDGNWPDRNLPSCPETPPSPLSPIMSPTTVDLAAEKKGHLCPPSKATHPCHRWECLFVYAFICKFTNLRGKVDGLNSAMECVRSGFVSFATLTPPLPFFPSFEEALLSTDPNPILTQILARFVLNLRPLTRNLRCVRVVVDPSITLTLPRRCPAPSSDQISHTVASVLAEFFKTPERTVFWNDDTRANVDPFVSCEEAKGGLWLAPWDFKVRISLNLIHITQL
jgi:hypothetical protein